MTDADAPARKKYVHVEFYIMSLDETTEPFFEALERAVKRGITVRVLLDHLASRRSPGYFRTIRQLEQMGVQWQLMLPMQPLRGRFQRPDLRNHRKLLVIDGDVAFTGSQNIIDPSYNKRSNSRRGLHWKDLMVRFEGPIVAGINALFVTDWYSETDELLLRETEPMPREKTLQRARRPGRAERPRIRGREQPPPVQLAALRRAGAHHHHQSVLRAR